VLFIVHFASSRSWGIRVQIICLQNQLLGEEVFAHAEDLHRATYQQVSLNRRICCRDRAEQAYSGLQLNE